MALELSCNPMHADLGNNLDEPWQESLVRRRAYSPPFVGASTMRVIHEADATPHPHGHPSRTQEHAEDLRDETDVDFPERRRSSSRAFSRRRGSVEQKTFYAAAPR